MALRELRTSPRIVPLYARAAVPLLPGASLLPFVAGRGAEIPELELTLPGTKVEPGRLAAYARVCGFGVRDTLPATYPHVLAFPLHMALMTDGRFPFPAVGLVHTANRITQHRPIGQGEELALRVHATPLEAHPRGRSFSLVSEARADGELVWEEVGEILRREKGRGSREERAAPSAPPASAEWRLPGDLGRRYASASGDVNPIHMHSLSAKAFGFPRAIAHGMWTKARCLAALESRLPEAFTVAASFRRPILLPSTVAFGSDEKARGISFAVREPGGNGLYVEGEVSW